MGSPTRREFTGEAVALWETGGRMRTAVARARDPAVMAPALAAAGEVRIG